MIFRYQGERYRTFGEPAYTPETAESFSRLTVCASELGGELVDMEFEGPDADDIAEQLGVYREVAA